MKKIFTLSSSVPIRVVIDPMGQIWFSLRDVSHSLHWYFEELDQWLYPGKETKKIKVKEDGKPEEVELRFVSETGLIALAPRGPQAMSRRESILEMIIEGRALLNQPDKPDQLRY